MEKFVMQDVDDAQRLRVKHDFEQSEKKKKYHQELVNLIEQKK